MENTQEKEKGNIYADYNGTTPLADEVIVKIATSLRDDWGNPSTLHELGSRARAAIEIARSQVAGMINGSPNCITFTSGGTESNNMVIFGLCQHQKDLCHVVTTNIEHDSIALPIKFLKETQGLQVTEVDASDYHHLAQNVIAAIRENTVLITVMAANNETGVILPLWEIGQLLESVNENRTRQSLSPVIFHSDAAQILGKEPVNVEELKLHCMTIVGHKFYGPRVGALWSTVPIHPLLFGGGNKLRPGTENTPMIVGLGAASALVTTHLTRFRKEMENIRNHLENSLKSLPVLVKINCSELPRLVNTCNVSFNLQGNWTGKDILSRCRRVLAGVGAACHSGTTNTKQCSRILINSGVPYQEALTSIRLSLGRETSIDIVNDIVSDLRGALVELLNEGDTEPGNTK